jgi:uncharacterized protein (DUF983 family)
MPDPAPKRPRIAPVLWRGLRRRCPRCGEGALFERWIKFRERCPVCGLLYQRNRGDVWIFIIVTDRIPVAIGVVALYFGFQATTLPMVVAGFVGLTAALIATMRERQGLALALDYLSRVYFPDPSDEIHRG